MLFEAGAAGASRPKSLYPSRLSPKVYALRTKIDPPLESKIGYNMGMIKNLADSPTMKFLAAAAVAWLFLPAILICIRIVYAILSCVPTIF